VEVGNINGNAIDRFVGLKMKIIVADLRKCFFSQKFIIFKLLNSAFQKIHFIHTNYFLLMKNNSNDRTHS
jgi:hypothetical protein